MCLAVPGKIIKIKDDIATIDYGVEKRSGKLIEKGFAVGDYAIVQGGIAIQKVGKKEAEAALKRYRELR